MLARLMKRLAYDRSAIAATEFALLLPLLLTLYIGSAYTMDAVACYRKITITARALADMTSQNTIGSTSSTAVDDSLTAGQMVLLPFNGANAILRISEITTTKSGQTQVVWSRAKNGPPYTIGQNISGIVPPSMQIKGLYFIYAEVTYNYPGWFFQQFSLPLKMSDSVFMVPRNYTNIPCSSC